MANPVYGKAATVANANTNEYVKKSGLFWTVIAGMILFLAWAPFQAALFNGQMLDFEKPLYWSAVIAATLFMLTIIVSFKNIRFEDQRDWLTVIVFLIPGTYFLSLLSAASHYLAVNMVLIQCIYAFLFVCAIFWLRDNTVNKVLQTAIITIAYIIIGFGFLNWFGQWVLAGKLVGWLSDYVFHGKYTSAVMSTAEGLRLTSVFQYANTYAAFLMAFFFVIIFCLITSKKWYTQLVHGFMLVPTIVSLILTLSRGGLILLPVVFVLLLLFIRPAKQLLWFFYSALAAVASLAILNPVTTLGTQLNQQYNGADAAKGWSYLLVASLCVAVISLLVQRFALPRLEKLLGAWSEKKLSNLWIPIVSVLLGVILIFLLIGTSLKNILPENISTRLDTINFNQNSVLERFTFYRDAIKLFSDYPVIGAGGGAWATLYEKYQNNPYVSRQAHNFFLQYLVEVGIVGFLIFIAFILFIFYKYIKNYIQKSEQERESHFIYFIITLSIFVHSTLDFNMSYVFMGILVFLGLGGMASSMQSQPVKRLKLKTSVFMPAYIVITGIIAVIVLFTGLRYVQSSNAAAEAKQLSRVSTSFEQIQAAINKDLSIRPTHPDSVIMLGALYQQAFKQTQNADFYNAGQAVLDRALQVEPFNKNMLRSKINLYNSNNEHEKSFEILKSNLANFRWDIQWYEDLIAESFTLGNEAYTSQNTEKMKEYFNTGMSAYQQVLEGIDYIKLLPKGQYQGRAFEVTPSIALNVGKIQFMSNKPGESAAILQPRLNEDLSDATNKEIARYYVAATQKQGQLDQVWYDKLIQADAKEKQQIEDLTALKLP